MAKDKGKPKPEGGYEQFANPGSKESYIPSTEFPGKETPPAEPQLSPEDLAAAVALKKEEEERIAAQRAAFTGSLLRGGEIPPFVTKEGTPGVVKDCHDLLVELQVGGGLAPHNVFLGNKVHLMILRIKDEYGVK